MHTPAGSPKGRSFRVTLSMKKEPDGQPVFCKMETSQRFKQLKTVKLNTNSRYRIDVSFKPPRALQSFLIQGVEVEAHERSRDSTACAYSIYHSTEGLSPSKRGERQDFLIHMKYLCGQVVGAGDLSTILQVKLYKENDTTHCEFGSRLHCIELDCSNAEGSGGLTVQKQTYSKADLDS